MGLGACSAGLEAGREGLQVWGQAGGHQDKEHPWGNGDQLPDASSSRPPRFFHPTSVASPSLDATVLPLIPTGPRLPLPPHPHGTEDGVTF